MNFASLCPVHPHPSDLRPAFLPQNEGREEQSSLPFPYCGGRDRGMGGFSRTQAHNTP